jgi:hypothetical protein
MTMKEFSKFCDSITFGECGAMSVGKKDERALKDTTVLIVQARYYSQWGPMRAQDEICFTIPKEVFRSIRSSSKEDRDEKLSILFDYMEDEFGYGISKIYIYNRSDEIWTDFSNLFSKK